MEASPPTPTASSPRDDWWWVFDPRYSLRARASLLFGGGALLLTLLLLWIAGAILHRQLEAQLGGSFETLAFQISDKIDRAIYERYRELQFTAALAPFREPGVSPAERRQVLETLQTASPDFAWIGMTDASGRITASTQGAQQGAGVADRPWFQGAREHPYAGPLQERPELSRQATTAREEPPRYLDLAVPVTASSGQFLGVLGAHLAWTWARDVQLSVVPESARRERLGVTIYSGPQDIVLDSGGSGWTQPPDAPALPDSRRFRGVLVEHAAGGTTYLTGFARSRGFREFRGLGWVVTVRQPAEIAFAPVTELQHSIARWGFIFVCLFGIGSWAFAAQTVRQFHRVAAAADRIHSGDILSVMPQPRQEGEFARMCSALAAMVGGLRQKQADLMAENDALKAREQGSTPPPPATPPRPRPPHDLIPW